MRGGRREGAGRKPGGVARIDAEARKRALAGGLMPLDFLLSVMRDEDREGNVRLDAAKAAAPYCHARLSSTEVSGPDKGPMQHEHIAVTDEMRARLGRVYCKDEGEILDWAVGGWTVR